MSHEPAASTYLSHRQIVTVMTGLLAGTFLAALDQSIVGTALPQITSDLGGLDKLSWVVTAYLLTSTAATPIWGKISDLVGRRPVYQAAIATFLGGSVMAALAGSMEVLVAGRAVQGIGAGGLLSLSMAVIGDIIPPRERGRYMGAFGAVWAISSVVGPLLGGVFTEQLGWPWIFWFNLPIGLTAWVVTSVNLRIHHARREVAIDYLGASAIVGSVTALILFLSWSGPERGWTHPTSLGLLAATIALGVLFVLVEGRAREPIIPLTLFRDWVFVSNVVYAQLMGIAMFAGIIFLPVYLQAVRGMTPTGSGVALIPMVGGIALTSMGSGQLMARFGRYKWMQVAGPLFTGLGLVALARLGVDTPFWVIAVGMVAFGVGLGFTMQVPVTAVQNAVPRPVLGAATAGIAFFRSMGNAVGAALFGAVLTTRIAYHLAALLPATAAGKAASVGGSLSDLTTIRALPDPVRGVVLEAMSRAIDDLFWLGVPFMAVALVLALFMRELPLRTRADAGGGLG